jgi:hypothetical protein
MVPGLASPAWTFDAGHTTELMLAATAINATAETIPIMRRGENRMTGCRRWLERDGRKQPPCQCEGRWFDPVCRSKMSGMSQSGMSSVRSTASGRTEQFQLESFTGNMTCSRPLGARARRWRAGPTCGRLRDY